MHYSRASLTVSRHYDSNTACAYENFAGRRNSCHTFHIGTAFRLLTMTSKEIYKNDKWIRRNSHGCQAGRLRA